MDAVSRKYIPDGLNTIDRASRFEHKFLVLRKLGQGTYGKVQLALNKETNEEVAVKTIKKAKIENDEDMLRIRREIHIMTSLRHPHIVHIHEVFESRQKIVIVMQYASGGELYDYLGCHQILPEDEARRIFRQIASAIYYCHKNQICHRDLKLENILLDEEGNAKIADFGLSNVFDDHHRMNTFCGSPLYASPEIVKGTPYKGPEVDCWSMGVLLYTLVYGTMPFDGRSFKELVTQISEGRYEEPAHKSNASSLIRWLLTPDISKRATIKDVCNDKWVNKGYDTSLLEVAENMASVTRLHREKILSTKRSLEITKNDREKSIFKKAAEQLEEKAGKFTSLFTKNFEVNGKRSSAGSQTQKTNFYEQITNYDVQFVLNKLIAAVEASIKAEKNLHNQKNSFSSTPSAGNALKKEEHPTEKVDSAYIIPIFEVTSTIPKDMNKNSFIIGKNKGNINNNFKLPRQENIQRENSGAVFHLKEKSDNGKKCLDATSERSRNLLKTDSAQNNKASSNANQKYSLNASNQPASNKGSCQTGMLQQDQSFSHPSFRKSKRINDPLPNGPKPPGSFLRTKNHVLSLARLLSLNYEKIIRNSFRMPACKKKPPGKITIPPTFDPNNPPTRKKQPEEKRDLLIFPTVSVSENKEKIQKKIEKIKNAALNKNIIIRSDSKTRIRIEQYIRSQVKKIQDLVREEQRSLQASLEHLDEQSLRDMSELYYRAFGSENTDSGIANTEEEEYFCFICSKPNNEKTMNGMVSSVNLENIRRGSLYTSNHLHIPKGKELNKWGYGSRINMELGSLNRCKSEIHFPIEYLNYISTNKSDLSKRTNPQQQIQKNQIGNTKYFSAISSVKQHSNTNYRVLRSASDSISLDFSKNAFDVLELSSDSTNFENYKVNPHFLEQLTSNECKFYENTDYDIQSCATDATFINRSQILENDDGIGDSNDSFQSYIGNLDSKAEHVITRSMSEHSCMNFAKGNSNNAFTKLSSDLHLKSKHETELDNHRRLQNRTDTTDTLDSVSLLSTIENENDNNENKGKNTGLRRRNTMSCLRRDSGTKTIDPNSEFESYLWNAYKEHLLENQTNSECSSSANLNYYSLDRKSNFRHLDSERIDDMNGYSTYDYMSKLFPNSATLEQFRGDENSPLVKNILKHSRVSLQCNSGSRLNRTKSVCPELLSESDRDDQIRRLKEEQRFWSENTIFDQNESKNHSITSSILNDVKKDRGRKTPKCLNRRRYSSNTLSLGKSTKSEYKKTFLQLLALKRIQEAEKELDKSNSSNLPPLEENQGSLLEALKTQGYKSVISQRFQDTNDDDYLDSFYTRYLKSPRNLRAELARLNHMYYQSLPRYMLGTYDENAFLDDMDYSGGYLSDLGTTSYYETDTPTYCDMLPDYRHQSRQCVYDWLDSTQADEYLSSLRPDSLNILDEIPFQTASDTRKCCTQWGRENFRSLDDESTSDSQSTLEETPSNSKYSTYQKNKEQNISIETNFGNTERFQSSPLNMNDEREESVQDRIWRKSFYPRFNNRHLFRKERSSLVDLELPENRLGLLNNLYNSNLKSGYDKPEYSLGNRSNTSFHSIRSSKKRSQSHNKFDSRSSMKKLYAKPSKEHPVQHDNKESMSDNLRELSKANENEEPEH